MEYKYLYKLPQLDTTIQKNYGGCEQILKYLNFPHFLTGKRSGEKVWEIQIF